jgi:hypothetical protein
MEEDEVEFLGSEDESTVKQRHALSKQLSILEKGLADLDAFTSRSVEHAVIS